jgi:hypothetical protein
LEHFQGSCDAISTIPAIEESLFYKNSASPKILEFKQLWNAGMSGIPQLQEAQNSQKPWLSRNTGLQKLDRDPELKEEWNPSDSGTSAMPASKNLIYKSGTLSIQEQQQYPMAGCQRQFLNS